MSLFNQAAIAIHQASPNTQFFTSFQLERLSGLRGGLYGGTNNLHTNNWSLLDDFSAADLLAFTSYPEIIYRTPSEIPLDYYQTIADHTAKPIAFTELGWPAADEAVGITGSKQIQR